MNKYCDIYYQPGENPVFCYRTGLAVYEETLYHGVLVSSGYNAAGYPLNVLSNYPTRLNPSNFPEASSFHVELNGISLDSCLEFVDFVTEKTEERCEAVLTLRSGILPVLLKVHTVLDGSAMFTRYIEIVNQSDETMNLSRLVLLSGGLEQLERTNLAEGKEISKLYSAGYFDDHCWGREGGFSWHDLNPGVLNVDSRFGRDRFRHPAIFLRNNVMGTMYFAQLGWSGGCRFSVDFNAYANQDRNMSQLAFAAEITAYNPMYILAAGETFVTPEVHMGIVAGGLDDAVNEMHDHIRRSVLSTPEIAPVDLTVGAGMGAEHDMSVETSKSFIRQFAEMGAEVFIIDAGWECPPSLPIEWGECNGINIPNPDRYPNGLAELSDYCHEQGLKFALWVEIERLGKYAPMLEQHPEWIAKDIYGGTNGGFIDFTVPEAAQWCEDELARIIEEYKLDMLRVDYNVSFRDYFAFREVMTGKRECLSVRHQQAVYRMYQNLKRRFPNVVFENCAGGGGRTDLGIMKSFNHTWVSDCQKAPQSVMITNGMTMVLPPERVDRLFAGMGCHAYGSFDLQMRNTMLTHMSLNIVAPAVTEPNPVQMEFVKHSVQIYKDFIRPMLPTARIYHHTPDNSVVRDDGFCAYEIAAPDGSKGAVAVYTLTSAGQTSRNILPKGINAGKTYKITLDNCRSSFMVSGYELLNNGIRINIPASMASELVLFEAVE